MRIGQFIGSSVAIASPMEDLIAMENRVSRLTLKLSLGQEAELESEQPVGWPYAEQHIHLGPELSDTRYSPLDRNVPAEEQLGGGRGVA
jgi:hypothetical protein